MMAIKQMADAVLQKQLGRSDLEFVWHWPMDDRSAEACKPLYNNFQRFEGFPKFPDSDMDV
jgi:hypothetical protein